MSQLRCMVSILTYDTRELDLKRVVRAMSETPRHVPREANLRRLPDTIEITSEGC